MRYYINSIKLRVRLRVATIKKASCARLRVRRVFGLRSCGCGNSKQVASHALVMILKVEKGIFKKKSNKKLDIVLIGTFFFQCFCSQKMAIHCQIYHPKFLDHYIYSSTQNFANHAIQRNKEIRCKKDLPYDILISEPICMMGKKSLGLRPSRSQQLLDFQSKLVQTSLDKSKLSKPKV